ncbi:hypothetical protein K435DRAFT_811434 [Dendrothele bispora CBS 962.96]|uniref:Uncharacterized protein n=1 Tax=Dendrothele bispora (strain CBS 962.96) TaxID=1314807 RepID=A0A4S8KS37_DENBC|nr:hypothetical protein K435DRAFT_811434 [Dendrothele bispora CBS 962.96]
MSSNKPSSPPPYETVSGRTNSSQFDRATLNSVGGNQSHDHRGRSSDTIRYDSRTFGTINGKYTENDNRLIHRNIENARDYHENRGNDEDSGWNTSVTTTAQQPRLPPNQIAQSNRPRENDNSRPGVRLSHYGRPPIKDGAEHVEHESFDVVQGPGHSLVLLTG